MHSSHSLVAPKAAEISNDNKAGCFVQSNELKNFSVNVTTWEKHSSSILHSGADVIALQETRLSAAGSKQAENALKSRHESWHGIWGSPPGDIVAKTGNTSKTETGKSSHGGVAIIAKNKFTLLPTGRGSVSAKTLFETSRWCASAIPLGPKGATARRYLHIVSFYGISNKRYGGRHTQDERLLQRPFCHATELGDQPVLLCMDANTTVESSLVLTQSLASQKWVDLGAHFAQGEPEYTYGASANWDKFSKGIGVTRPV